MSEEVIEGYVMNMMQYPLEPRTMRVEVDELRLRLRNIFSNGGRNRIKERAAEELKLQQSVGTLSGSDQLQNLWWCEEHGVAPLKVDHDNERDPVTDKCYVNSLLERLSSLYHQKEAAKELQRLKKTIPSCRCRAVFSEFPDGITRLLDPLSLTKVDSDPELQEDLIAMVVNILTDDNNKKLVVDHPVVIPLLAEWHPLAVKEAASAILSLCEVSENKAKLTELGAVKLIIQKMGDGIFVDELSSILELLCQHPDAIDEFMDPKIFLPIVEIRKASDTFSLVVIISVFVNGKLCKDPKLAKAVNFFFSGFNMGRNTSSPIGSTVTPINVVQIQGLNSLGILLVRISVIVSQPIIHFFHPLLRSFQSPSTNEQLIE
ncbi:hypothetical protein F3Y22_tig00113096pilonHSYRG00192 [Hibiscus syriacus]|uniref:Uncharacterized protein n=1 Tax=Hibiscus syriacus TaxID=106335 RepID=A0A6A2Y409_HIBSY|nr:hypothetical protein F3Y22_tig00113096pilonHSYRG00192 [Hibiscus syriacus]